MTVFKRGRTGSLRTTGCGHRRDDAGMMRRRPALAGSLQKVERGHAWQRWRQAITISTSWVS